MSLPALANSKETWDCDLPSADTTQADRPPLLALHNVVQEYRAPATTWFRRRSRLRVLDGVSITLAIGQTLALVGESGCGKSTTGKIALGTLQPTAGRVSIDGIGFRSMPTKLRTQSVQMVFQHPRQALDPRLPVGAQIEEPLLIGTDASRSERRLEVRNALERVGLTLETADRFPHQLSGGQAQRVVIARALISQPRLLILDEPLSALDVSVQAQIINLLVDLQAENNTAYLFISHDLRAVSYLADWVAVMYLGRIVEIGKRSLVIGSPAHPYTQALIQAIPEPDPHRKPVAAKLRGEAPSFTDLPQGCRFHTRCPFAKAICKEIDPMLTTREASRAVACHFAHDHG